VSKSTQFFALLLVLWLGSACASAAERWISVQSPNFEVITNAGEKTGREVLFRFEQMRALLQTLFPKLRTDPGQPIIVMAFRDEKSFRPFATKDVKFWVGYFQAGHDKHFIALRTDRGDEPFRTIFHEYMHMVLSLNFAGLPRWLDEGLAEFYAYTDIRGLDVMLGKPSENHILHLRESKLLPVEELFRVDFNSPHYNERDRASIFYAEAWMVVHWLMLSEEGNKRKALGAVMNGVKNGKDPIETLQALGLGASTFDKKMKSYVEQLSFPAVQVKLKSFAVEKQSAVRPLDSLAVHYYAGDLLLHTQRFPDAVARFHEALKQDPNFAPAMEGLGLVAIRNQEWEEAEKWLGKAVALEAQNFLAHYYYASVTMRRLSEGFTFDAAQETLEKAERALRRTLELRPDFAPALQWLASLLMFQGESLEEAEKLAVKALSLEPRNIYARTTLAQIYARQDRIPQARQTILVALSGARPEERPMLELVRQQIEDHAARLAEREAWEREQKAAESQPVRAETLEPTGVPRETTSVSAPTTPPPVGFLRGKVTAVACEKGLTLTVLSSGRSFRFHRPDIERLAQVSGTTVEKLCSSAGSAVSVNYYAQPREGFDGEVFLLELRSAGQVAKAVPAETIARPTKASSFDVRKMTGQVVAVRCEMPMVFEVQGRDSKGGARVLRLRASLQLEFHVQSAGAPPPQNFNPCDSKGLTARVTYQPLPAGSEHDGELTRIDFIWKGP
jgi:tetratricopeptide (TPR) repeat protein